MTLVVAGREALLREAGYAAEGANDRAKQAEEKVAAHKYDEAAASALVSISLSLRELCFLQRAQASMPIDTKKREGE